MENNKNNKEDKIEEKKISLFDSKQNIFGNQDTTTSINSKSLFGSINQSNTNTFNSNIENKKEEKTISNNNENKNLFNPTFNIGTNPIDNNIFGIKNNNKKNESIFFNSNTSNIQNNQLFNKPQEKGNIFNQQTTTSSSINNKPLFISNKTENNELNKDGGSLLNKNNPFLTKANIGASSSNIFGNTQISNQSKQQPKSLFGNFDGRTSIFGNGNNKINIFGM